MKAIKERFNAIKNNKFLWPQLLKKRNQKRPFLSRFFFFWALFQTILIHRLKIKKPFREVKTFWGDRMTMILPHPTFLYFYGILGRNEIFLTDFIINYLKIGDVFIDGGANIGYYSLLASKIVGNNGQVYSFEPTPRIYSILKNNLKRKKNAHPYRVALLDENKMINFTDFGLKHSLYNSVNELPENHIAKKESKDINNIIVETKTIDRFCKNHNLKPDFIKLDIEGSESRAILGAKKIISKYKPIIAMEIWDYAVKKGDFRKIHKILSEQSYSCYQLIDDFKLLLMDSSNQNFDPKFYNIVFIPKNKNKY